VIEVIDRDDRLPRLVWEAASGVDVELHEGLPWVADRRVRPEFMALASVHSLSENNLERSSRKMCYSTYTTSDHSRCTYR
jgi:hypothetical protein